MAIPDSMPNRPIGPNRSAAQNGLNCPAATVYADLAFLVARALYLARALQLCLYRTNERPWAGEATMEFLQGIRNTHQLVIAGLALASLLAPLPQTVGGTTLSARPLSAATIEQAAGRWVSYSWDGEGAPERFELQLEIDADRDRFHALLVRPGQSPLRLSGALDFDGRLNSTDGTILELRADAALELRRPARGGQTIAFWQE